LGSGKKADKFLLFKKVLGNASCWAPEDPDPPTQVFDIKFSVVPPMWGSGTQAPGKIQSFLLGK